LRSKRVSVFVFIALLLLIGIAFVNYGFVKSSGSSTGAIQHVILVMMENENYQNIIGSSSAPYINQLAKSYALATNYYGIEYPSLPNYIDITSGSNGGITTDCDTGPSSGGCETSQSTIFNLLEKAGLTWKAYEESMPSNCYTSDSGDYIVHHNPVPYETSVSDCSKYDVPMGSTTSGNFYNDVKNGNLPNFSFLTPNGCDDMHGVSGSCSKSISTGDTYLSNLIPLIQSGPQYSSTIVIITWDTGDCSSPCNQTANGGGQVATIVVGPSSLVNYGKFNTFYNHYSTLATIEDIFGLGNLGRNDATATPMSAIVNY
jgi:phospholipase C